MTQKTVEILRVQREEELVAMDRLAVEAPLEIRVEGRPVAVVMRTPGHDRELAAGFLLSEGVVVSRDDVFEISLCPAVQDESGVAEPGVVDVLLAKPEAVDFDRLTRHVFTSSSCGLCGKAVVDEVLKVHPPLVPGVPGGLRVTADLVTSLPEVLRREQAAFAATGGLHASAIVDPEGRLSVLREDVGRHNALDKVLGSCWLSGQWPLADRILVLSGRVSFELVQKALVARLPIIVAISAPSSLAVAAAEAAGITLCGFVRDGRMNIYSHPGRIGRSGISGAASQAKNVVPESAGPIR